MGVVASDGTVPMETLIARADSALYQLKIKDVINGLINPAPLPGEGKGMKRIAQVALLALLLTGCAGEKGIIDRDGYQLDTRHPAQAAYPRIKVLVIHYTADNFDVSLATLTDKEVSSHYLIPEQPPRYQHKPRIWQLVPEEDLARARRGELLARQYAYQ